MTNKDAPLDNDRRPAVGGQVERQVGLQRATVCTRPILFGSPMVRALLAGTKTQTRRAPHITRCNDLEIRALIRAVEAAHGITGPNVAIKAPVPRSP